MGENKWDCERLKPIIGTGFGVFMVFGFSEVVYARVGWRRMRELGIVVFG